MENQRDPVLKQPRWGQPRPGRSRTQTSAILPIQSVSGLEAQQKASNEKVQQRSRGSLDTHARPP